ncbi:ATP-binding protein [Cognatilysobacter bugurensis]|uniref:Transcriptional regulator n=1 Tax=Cognatilysobacter bugurensis TaxID=543356 RepID=A0A918T195_9GAMM|nr:ATP-binding protein [Lysobacter bugurensis]GHA80247.1 transcriptional regulator [Lysobacter bugurensis]
MVYDTGQWQLAALDDTTQVGAARRLAARAAEFAGLTDVMAGRLGLVVVELATNLLKHATRGRLLLRADGQGEDAAVDVVAIDHGPGMDLGRCFDDGYSTSGTPGTGLGAVRRAATLFDAHSDARGSVLFARIGDTPGPRRGSIALALAGELDSGDGWQFIPTAQGWSAALSDGLGHGPGAAAATEVVLRTHGEHPEAPARCLQLAHERARATRGAACSIVVHDHEANALTHAGIGNVAASVIGLDDSRGFAGQSGTLGATCPAVREQRIDVSARSLVVLHSDGLSARWRLSDYPGLRTRHPQVIAGVLFRDAQRPRDDATVLVIET